MTSAQLKADIARKAKPGSRVTYIDKAKGQRVTIRIKGRGVTVEESRKNISTMKVGKAEGRIKTRASSPRMKKRILSAQIKGDRVGVKTLKFRGDPLTRPITQFQSVKKLRPQLTPEGQTALDEAVSSKTIGSLFSARVKDNQIELKSQIVDKRTRGEKAFSSVLSRNFIDLKTPKLPKPGTFKAVAPQRKPVPQIPGNQASNVLIPAVPSLTTGQKIVQAIENLPGGKTVVSKVTSFNQKIKSLDQQIGSSVRLTRKANPRLDATLKLASRQPVTGAIISDLSDRPLRSTVETGTFFVGGGAFGAASKTVRPVGRYVISKFPRFSKVVGTTAKVGLGSAFVGATGLQIGMNPSKTPEIVVRTTRDVVAFSAGSRTATKSLEKLSTLRPTKVSYDFTVGTGRTRSLDSPFEATVSKSTTRFSPDKTLALGEKVSPKVVVFRSVPGSKLQGQKLNEFTVYLPEKGVAFRNVGLGKRKFIIRDTPSTSRVKELAGDQVLGVSESPSKGFGRIDLVSSKVSVSEGPFVKDQFFLSRKKTFTKSEGFDFSVGKFRQRSTRVGVLQKDFLTTKGRVTAQKTTEEFFDPVTGKSLRKTTGVLSPKIKFDGKSSDKLDDVLTIEKKVVKGQPVIRSFRVKQPRTFSSSDIVSSSRGRITVQEGFKPLGKKGGLTTGRSDLSLVPESEVGVPLGSLGKGVKTFKFPGVGFRVPGSRGLKGFVPISASGVSSKVVSLPRVSPVTRSSLSTKPISKVIVSNVQKPVSSTKILSDSSTVQQTTPDSVTDYSFTSGPGPGLSVPFKGFSYVPPPISFPKVPPVVLPRLPRPGGGGLFPSPKSSRRLKRRLKYTPSVVAQQLGIKVKKRPKQLTGLEIRGVL